MVGFDVSMIAVIFLAMVGVLTVALTAATFFNHFVVRDNIPGAVTVVGVLLIVFFTLVMLLDPAFEGVDQLRELCLQTESCTLVQE